MTETRPSGTVKLARHVATLTGLSRRAADRAVEDGRVRVDALTVREPGAWIAESATLTLDGTPLQVPTTARTFSYYAYAKPRGELVTASDPRGRPTIYEHFPKHDAHLRAVGRLDYDTEGLILVLSDGELINRLMHPRYEVPRTYLAWVSGFWKTDDARALPTDIPGLKVGERARWSGGSLLEVTLAEGKYHEVRELCADAGHAVVRLRRIAYGAVGIGKHDIGEFWELSPRTITILYRSVGLNPPSTLPHPPHRHR